MDAALAFGIGALLAGSSAAFFLAECVCGAFLRKHRSAAAVYEAGKERLAWVLRSGCRPLMPVGDCLLMIGSFDEAVVELSIELEARGLKADKRALASVVVLSLVVLFAGSSLIARTVVGGAAVTACALVCLITFCRTLGDKRRNQIVEGVPGALRSMSVCFRAGLSLMQTLRQTGKETGGALGARFERAARALETGSSSAEALEEFRRQAGVPELAFVAVALDVQHQSGGSIGHVLDVARESLESELELRRSLRVQTAQARLSARIVTVMPFLLVALFSVMSEGFLSPFFESWAGFALLILALGMQAAGVLLVRRMLRVEEG